MKTTMNSSRPAQRIARVSRILSWCLGLLILLTLACAISGQHGVSADGAAASVTPGDGDMRTGFVFAATGLTPGHAILITLYDSSGNRYTYQKDGVDQAIVVDDSGAVSLQVTPATDLPGSVPGDWQAYFMEEESGYTASVPFTVAP
jgi:hypothetical protein